MSTGNILVVTTSWTYLVVHRVPLPSILATLALGRWSPLFLDFKEGSFGMGTSGYPVALDARRTGELFVVDQYHGRRCLPAGLPADELVASDLCPFRVIDRIP